MNLKDLDIKRTYRSYGDDNITNALLVPALKVASLYRRSVGFFSSSVFCSILDGVEGLKLDYDVNLMNKTKESKKTTKTNRYKNQL